MKFLAKSAIITTVVCALWGASTSASPPDEALAKTVHDFKVSDIAAESVSLKKYAGKVLLLVNTASRCGYTPQYAGLQQLQDKYSNKNFTVLGFPSNDFGGQEPGSNGEIKKFCELNYRVNFPLFEKGPVSGRRANPLFRFLTNRANPTLTGEIEWNFEKFLISRDGKLVARFKSPVFPMSPEITSAIEAQLKK
jgi:glutathione peroxidase